jgi:hypothetical protein
LIPLLPTKKWEQLSTSSYKQNTTQKAMTEKQTKVSDKWILEEKPNELLQECFYVISSILRHDPFKRFIRTEECEKIMKQFQNDSSVISPAIIKNLDYQISDFKNPYIDDKDIDFFKNLMEDGYNWKVRFFFF